MAMTKSHAKTARAARTVKSAASKILGITKDGVRILKPRGNATHFTQKEVRDAVARARASRQAG